eukprot:m.69886 g.69886  ORF g.69886 m.69886 type:complete len:400 (+) comp24151_c0_seq1:135-1334(+)
MSSKCLVRLLVLWNVLANTCSQPTIESDGNTIVVTAQDGFSVNNVEILKAITDLTQALADTKKDLATTTTLLTQTRGELADVRTQLQSVLVNTTANQVSIATALNSIDDTNIDVGAVNNTVTNLANVSMDLRVLTTSNGNRVEALQQTVNIMSEQLNELNYSFYKDDGFSRSCLEHYNKGARIDGSYPIQELSDTEVTTVYCDMKNGGWTLTAMVHTCTNQKSRTSEPRDFWTSGGQRTSPYLQKNINKDCRQPMAIGTSHLLDQVTRADSPMLKIVFHAEEDITVTAEWYKVVTEDSFKTYFLPTNGGFTTQGCTNEAMTLNCRATAIQQRSVTEFVGMYVYDDEGPITNRTPHMRMDDDPNNVGATGICSLTGQDTRWPDSAGDGHWGNGVRIWLKA